MLTIILKGTNGCNLACSYCSLGKKNNFKCIDKSILRKTMQYACGLAEYRKEKEVNFILHGGEPTLVNPEIYDECIAYVKEKYAGLEIIISMQTNGLVITDRFMQLIKKYDIRVGISIDGSKKIHNSERRTTAGRESFEMVTKNIDKLLAASVQVSCLMVLTQNALNENLYYLHFFADRGLHLKINPLLNYGETQEHPELVLEKGDYANYIIRVYEEVIQKNLNVYVSPIDKIIDGIICNHPIRECTFNKKCNKYFLCFDYKGDIYPCGRFSDIEEMRIGNIEKQSYVDIEKYLQKHIYIRRDKIVSKRCSECRYLKLCNGGCSAEALIEGKFLEAPALCDDYLMLFKYFNSDGLKLLRKVLMKNRKFLEEQI